MINCDKYLIQMNKDKDNMINCDKYLIQMNKDEVYLS